MPAANTSSQVLRLDAELVPDAAEKDRLSDFSWTLHHRQLFLKLKQPVHCAPPPKVHGLRGRLSYELTKSNRFFVFSALRALSTHEQN